jgi:hypothetical protein
MNIRTKALLYQFLSFAILFLIFRELTDVFSSLQGIWVSLVAFAISTLLAPQFKVVRTKDGDKLVITWILMKGVKVIK